MKSQISCGTLAVTLSLCEKTNQLYMDAADFLATARKVRAKRHAIKYPYSRVVIRINNNSGRPKGRGEVILSGRAKPLL